MWTSVRVWTIRPLLIIQLVGFSATAILHLGLKLMGTRLRSQRQASVVDSQQEKEKVQKEPQKKFISCCSMDMGSASDLFSRRINCDIYGFRQTLPDSLRNRTDCVLSRSNDGRCLGFALVYCERSFEKTKQRADSGNTILNRLAYCVKRLSQLWFFRSPRDVSFTLLGVCTAMYMMCANVLWVVIIGHIATGALYVRENIDCIVRYEKIKTSCSTHRYVFMARNAVMGFDLLRRPQFATYSGGVHSFYRRIK